MLNSASTNAVAACPPGRFLVASGARRGERPDRHKPPPTPPHANPSRTTIPDALRAGPPEAHLILTFHHKDTRQEPMWCQIHARVCVEDDRREDDFPPRSAAT